MVHKEHTHTGPDGSPKQCLEPSSENSKWTKRLCACDFASNLNDDDEDNDDDNDDDDDDHKKQ